MTERVIITAKLLNKMFGHLHPVLFDFYLRGLVLDTAEETIEYYERRITEAKKLIDDPTKNELPSVWQNMLFAYQKMTVFEREAIKRDLKKQLVNFQGQ